MTDVDKPAVTSISRTLRFVIALIWSEADRYTRRQLALSFALLVSAAALMALSPVVYKFLIDALTGKAPPQAYLTPAFLIGAMVLAQYFLGISGGLRALVHGLGTQRLNRRLSNRLFSHIVRLPLRYHLDRKTGAIGETLDQGLGGCQVLLQHLVFTFLPVTIEFLVIVLVLVNFGYGEYLWIIGLSGIAYSYAFWRGAATIVEPSKVVSTSQIDAYATLTDSLINCETVKYFNAESAICGRFDSALTQRENAWRSLLRMQTANGLLIATIFTLSTGSTIAYTAHEVLNGHITVGDFVLINGYVLKVIDPIQTIGLAIREVSQGLAFLEKMLEMFREVPEADALLGKSTLSDARGELVFDKVSLSYLPGQSTLQDISFSVRAGHTVAIVGVSGSGKSSMIRLLFRLYEPDAGRILLDGVPIRDIPLQDLRRAIAIVPQDTVLFNDTLGSNIAFGRPDATQEEIESAAKLAHLDTFIERLPTRYDTPVGERGLKLSGGERQRVAIARAALKRPRIFVFDEATSSLDSKTEREILDNLMEVGRTSTTLVIAHRLSTVVHADEILVLNEGEIVERGTHHQLLERNGSYAGLWRAQQNTRIQAVTPLPAA